MKKIILSLLIVLSGCMIVGCKKDKLEKITVV